MIDHIIPPMTNPLGRHWPQPNREDILIDDEHALMTHQSFVQLANYDCSTPSGVYHGKMWKCDVAVTAPDKVKAGGHRYWLRWFGYGQDEQHCTIHNRKILTV